MIKSWSVLLLCICIALQLVASFPQPDDDNNANAVQSSSAENVLGLPRNQLLLGTLGILTNQSRFILRSSTTFMKDLIREMNALPEKSKAIERNITRVSSVLAAVERIDLDAKPPLINQMFAAVDEVGKIYDEFYGMPENNDTKSDAAVLEKIFEKVGSESLEKRFNDSLDATLDDFMKLFDNFATSLSEKEKQSESQLLNWYERFKKEEDVEKKFDHLEEFWRYFE
ncbi:uncharacterized protein LOC129249078 [Anastrepha obliqua]|uniref:uncharacterized protein LOC129249078 n=1 Tax=Anastrepha obliqua TaxID=95512 RepID=UPI002409CDB5|nr:uncharacterized protein LOC129249078 [Anastrepha obliqua]